MAAQSGVPLSVVIEPLAEHPEGKKPPQVNFGQMEVVRCRQCRTYMNPFVLWMENGRRWKCNLCQRVQDTLSQYYCHLDESGMRADRMQRPELHSGCIDIVAPEGYQSRPPMAAAYVFVLDVSEQAVRTGMLHTAVTTVKKTLNNLLGGARTRIGFITFDTTIHFYNLSHKLTRPQMLVVGDLNDIFLPSKEDLLVNLKESRGVVDTLLSSLPTMHSHSHVQRSAAGSAIDAAYRLMHGSGGKLCLFMTQLPVLGEGKLPTRENPRALGTDQEHLLLNNASKWYTGKASDFASNSHTQICVDLFCFPGQQYLELATLKELVRLTGGQVHYYAHFHASRDGEKLFRDLLRVLTRETAWEACMRVRSSKHITVGHPSGNHLQKISDLLSMPNADADGCWTVELHHADKVAVGTGVSIQTALLYTNSMGERTIRVMTNYIPITDSPTEFMQSTDLQAIMNVTAKKALDKTLLHGFEMGRRHIQTVCADMMRGYKSVGGFSTPGFNAPTTNSPSPLPPNLQELPRLSMALIKNACFRGGSEISLDERSYLHQTLKRMPIRLSSIFFEPRLYAIVEGEAFPRLALSNQSLNQQGVFLVDNGLVLYLWVGHQSPPQVLQALFGVPSLDKIDASVLKVVPSEQDSALKTQFMGFVSHLQQAHCKAYWPQLVVVKERDAVEQRVFQLLIEDKATFGSGAYTLGEFVNNLSRMSATPLVSGATR